MIEKCAFQSTMAPPPSSPSLPPILVFLVGFLPVVFQVRVSFSHYPLAWLFWFDCNHFRFFITTTTTSLKACLLNLIDCVWNQWRKIHTQNRWFHLHDWRRWRQWSQSVFLSAFFSYFSFGVNILCDYGHLALAIGSIAKSPSPMFVCPFVDDHHSIREDAGDHKSSTTTKMTMTFYSISSSSSSSCHLPIDDRPFYCP